MQAITTKYLGHTTTRPSRVKATCAAGSVTVPVEDDSRAYSDPHTAAFVALVKKIGWDDNGRWYAGDTPTGKVFVCSPKYASSAVNIV